MDINRIIESTLQGKTVIFLGPEATINYGSQDRLMLAFREIQNNCPAGLILKYPANDSFMIFGDKRAKIYGQERIKAFYSNDFVNPSLEKIAEIPFALYVSTTPDLTLEKTFDKKKFAYKSTYYSHKNLRKIDELPTSENPLLYHVFGRIDDVESAIFSYSDLFNYIKSLNAYEFLPELFRKQLKENTEHIIFLGLNFEKWHYQILLNILNLDVDPCFQYSVSPCEPVDCFKTLYEEHFQITFVDNNIEHFVNQLYNAFPKDKLRKPLSEQQKPKKYLKNNILKFINAAYNATDFETLCLINFEEVYNEFTPEQGQMSRINKLLDHVMRNDLYDNLLQIGKEDNPLQFERFQPFFE